MTLKTATHESATKEAASLAHAFWRRVAESGPAAALLERRGKQLHSVSWNELAADVVRLVRLLGVITGPGDRIALVSENRREWIACDLAIATIGGVSVPIHATLSGEQVAEQINDSQARAVFVSTAETVKKLAAVAGRLPADVLCFSFEPARRAARRLAIETLDEAAPRTADLKPEDYDDARQLASQLKAESLATIMYTSGTSGRPRGVQLTHGNLAHNARAMVAAFGGGPAERRVCFLPLSHVFARTCDLYTWIIRGSQLALSASRDTILDDIQAVRPTFLNGVPYFFDRVMRGLQRAGKADVSAVPALSGAFGVLA